MKFIFKGSWKRTVAFVCALTILASATFVSAFADDKIKNEITTEVKHSSSTNKDEPAIHVDNHSRQLPSLTGSKMKLSDPHFSSKEWYEYVEYEDQYTEVKDGSVTYRIHKPKSYKLSFSVLWIAIVNAVTFYFNAVFV